MSTNDKLADALRGLIKHVDRETCRHEVTHRGGAIWTICDACGMKWADDQGGFVPYTDAAAVAEAREALAAHAASIAAPPAQGEWQPIETAPKDGTRVLLSWDGTRVGYYLDNSASSRPWEGWKVPSLEPWPKDQPIAWMPMPAPATAAPRPAPAPVQVDDWWRVEVSDIAGQIVAIELDTLSGREIGEHEEAVIREAIDHLRGFIGDSAQPPAPGEAVLPPPSVKRAPWRYGESITIKGLYSESEVRAAIAALAQQRVPDAIDLAQFRPAVRVWKQDCAAWGDNEGEAMAERLLALIDQQQEARK